MWEMIAGAVLPLVGALVRHLIGERKWSAVNKVASGLVKAHGTEPRDAVIQAVDRVLGSRITKSTEKVKAIVLNGTGPHRIAK